MKKTLIGVAVGVVAALLAVFVWPSGSSGSTTKAASGNPNAVGIKVHGKWTIDVRNPDGSLANHRVFENSLEADGQDTLARLLTRENSIGLWTVALRSQGVCPLFCALVEDPSAATSDDNIDVFRTLEVSRSESHVLVQGTMSAPASGDITGVGTWLDQCSNTLPLTSPCAPSDWLLTPFTWKWLPTPISVAETQQVLVTVDISFS